MYVLTPCGWLTNKRFTLSAGLCLSETAIRENYTDMAWLQHMSTASMDAFQKFGFKHSLVASSCSFDFAPSYCYLFLNMKKKNDGCHFASDDEVMNVFDISEGSLWHLLCRKDPSTP